jgi:hypothetical protein
MNIEPSTWKKTRRTFPWQVRVNDTGAFKAGLTADELRRLVTLTATKMGLLPPAELSEDQTAAVMVAMQRNNAG